MEWLKKLLKDAGFEESKIDEFVTEFNKEVPNHLIPKAKYNELSDTKKRLEADLQERDTQLETLKEAAGSSKKLQEQIEQLQADNKTAKEQFEAETKELRTNTAVKLALAGKVHDPDIVATLLDKEKFEFDDNGNIKSGLDDQLKSLQESKGFLFVPEKSESPTFTGFKPFDGKPGGEGEKSSGIGKQLAENNKKNIADVTKAQANYFGGASE